MAFKSYPGQCSCGNICNRLEKSGTCPCLIQIQQDILGTDSAASSRVGQNLLFRMEGSIPYSAPLNGGGFLSEMEKQVRLKSHKSPVIRSIFTFEYSHSRMTLRSDVNNNDTTKCAVILWLHLLLIKISVSSPTLTCRWQHVLWIYTRVRTAICIESHRYVRLTAGTFKCIKYRNVMLYRVWDCLLRWSSTLWGETDWLPEHHDSTESLH